ncbi:F510_1955 family glycosylhydrolase [Streptomyces sp. NPDC090025]|uniref:F510_1955 family glycosylhydrolase n=1 Tax=Streptomyces sp. NPDC090025 TaxID=3365922 RepID=UPI0038329141
MTKPRTTRPRTTRPLITRPRAATAALALALSLAVTLTLTACGSGSGRERSSADDGHGSPLAHIHGVGESGGKLYVATHDGLYTPDADGRPVRVGERRDDFMGFTVAPDGRFLASGHPAPGSGGPADLGLVESTDGGVSWTTRSLAGEVDFHALDTSADGTVLGYDATNAKLRVSRDGVRWEERATLKALDVAVAPTPARTGARAGSRTDSPAGAATVLATTDRGVVRSTDGGRNFGRPLSPQVIAYVDWAAPDALFGVDPDGVLLRGADGGARWTRVGVLPGGAPQALTVLDGRRILAATRDGVYASADGGRTFTLRMATGGAPAAS